jgi:hypothetical protein
VLFDAANVNECYRRSESVIPQQALAIANSPLALQQSRMLAGRLSQVTGNSSDTNQAFIHMAFEQILTRPASDGELAMCEKFLASQAARLADSTGFTQFAGERKVELGPATDSRQRARENLVHVLLNHNDFVTIR